MKNKLSLVAIILSSFFFLNCGSSTVEQQETEQDTENQEFKERVELSKIIQTTPYTRYFLFKGDNLISVKEGLKWWSTTYKIDWTVKESKYKDWVLVKMIKEDIGAEVSDFHNMSSLFFNKAGSPVDLKPGDFGMTIAIADSAHKSYITYINHEIFQESRKLDQSSCEVLGVFQNDEKGIMGACYSGVYETNRKILDFNELLKLYNIDLQEIQNDSIPGEIMNFKSEF